MRPIPSILVLAAGASTRMRGADKLLEAVDGTPIVLRATRAASAVSPEVIVALPPGSARRAWLADTAARLIEVEAREMSASIRAGVSKVTRDAVMIHLADMPEIAAAEMQILAEAWSRSSAPILRATTEDGAPGQPVIFTRSLFPKLLTLNGDQGAKSLLKAANPEVCALPGQAALVDLDTPEAWAAWRAQTGR